MLFRQSLTFGFPVAVGTGISPDVTSDIADSPNMIRLGSLLHRPVVCGVSGGCSDTFNFKEVDEEHGVRLQRIHPMRACVCADRALLLAARCVAVRTPSFLPSGC
tara:strand:- start:174 stop:488 length:315 start_codon:yes stop_codon:yes gene_type:complete